MVGPAAAVAAAGSLVVVVELDFLVSDSTHSLLAEAAVVDPAMWLPQSQTTPSRRDSGLVMAT
jgi:hypothetical protein